MRHVFKVLGVIGISSLAIGARSQDPAGPAFYTANVKPILESNCYKCHGGENHRGGLSMVTRESLLKGGHHGPAVVPGDPTKSLLVTLIHHEGQGDDPMPMPPPPRTQLTSDQISTVEQWIKAGVAMPDEAAKP